MELIINGKKIEFGGEVKITPNIPNKVEEKSKYTLKDWCRLIAFLINSDFLAFYQQPKLLTFNDVWESNPCGELAFLLDAIDMLKTSLKEENEFTDICNDILNGNNIQADKKYASTTGLELYLMIFPVDEKEKKEIEKFLTTRN